jgi:2-amino-4-hydroxy-6-hydroxymethyldihydropteridine diphosphokinase
MGDPTTAYIGLGSNLDDRAGHIDSALKMLSGLDATRLVRVSQIVETEPLGDSDHPRYLNGVAEIETTLAVAELHSKTAEIEITLGRTRLDKWSPRTIDLDLLLFGDKILQTDDLAIPHPQMHLRSFVLAGLCELNDELIHPVIGESMGELAGRLNGCDFALDPRQAQLISVAGIIGVGKTTLTGKLAESFECRSLLEAYDRNPFLSEVYSGNTDLALDSQLFFLTSRMEQMNPGSLAAGKPAVSDYVFEKELIYARRLLSDRQLALYEDMYNRLHSEAAAPVLVIFLQDSPENCLERIHRRSRPYEQQIELEFLKRLSEDYERLFAEWRRCPAIRLSVSDFDCRSDEHVGILAKQIRNYLAL